MTRFILRLLGSEQSSYYNATVCAWIAPRSRDRADTGSQAYVPVAPERLDESSGGNCNRYMCTGNRAVEISDV